MRFLARAAILTLSCLPAALSGPAAAQPAPSPAQIVPQGSPLDRDRQPNLPATAPGLQVPLPPPASGFAPGQTVRIGSSAITGATAYPPADLAALTEGLTGPAVPLSRIEQARQALLARYRGDGFLLSTVSSAVDAAGNLRFTVVEGYIADVKLDGNIGPAGVQTLRFLNRIMEERPLRISTLERYLLLANDIPGVSVKAVLRPSADDPAAVSLIAQVSRKAFDGLLAADNRAFRQTGSEQMLAVGVFNSFSQFGERTELSLLHSFNNTQTFGQAATEFYLGGSGLKVRLYGGIGGTNPSGNDLRGIGYDGRTRVFGAQATYPIIRSRDQTLNVLMAFDAIESDIHTDTGVDNSAVRASFDSLRILRWGTDYALQDTLFGDSRTGVNNMSVRLSKGIDGLGATSFGDPQAGRPGSRTDFLKGTAEITRSQTLFQPWTNASLVLFGLISGQVSDSVLPPSEKFFLGGIRFNRGFYAGQVTGDNALTGSVELQLNTSFTGSLFGISGTVAPQFYVFHDWGETWENQNTDANHRLRSAGGGVRAQLTQYLAMEVEGVNRVTRFPQGGAGTVKPLKADALYWRAVTKF